MFIRLALYWYLYMAGLGIFFPYYSHYLEQDLHLSGTQIGLVMAILPLVGILTQPLWGILADHTGSRRGVLAGIVAGSAVGYALIGLAESFVTVVLATVFLALFSTAVLPMSTAVTLASVGEQGAAGFGRVRMWGTLGFLTLVVSLPLLLEVWAASPYHEVLPWRGLGIMFLLSALLSTVASAVALSLPPVAALSVRSEPGDIRRLLRHPPVLRLLLWVFLAHSFMQGPVALFPLYITDRGGDLAVIAGMWVFMLLLEIPLIGFSGRSLRRFGARGLLTLGLLAEGLRWTISAWTTDLEVIRAVQLLHGVGVAGVLVGGPLYLEQAVPRRLRSTGQALVSTAGFGVGSIVSTMVCGWLFDRVGPSAPYAIAGAGLLVLAALAHRALPEPYRPPEPSSARGAELG